MTIPLTIETCRDTSALAMSRAPLHLCGRNRFARNLILDNGIERNGPFSRLSAAHRQCARPPHGASPKRTIAATQQPLGARPIGLGEPTGLCAHREFFAPAMFIPPANGFRYAPALPALLLPFFQHT